MGIAHDSTKRENRWFAIGVAVVVVCVAFSVTLLAFHYVGFPSVNGAEPPLRKDILIDVSTPIIFSEPPTGINKVYDSGYGNVKMMSDSVGIYEPYKDVNWALTCEVASGGYSDFVLYIWEED